MKTGGNAEEGSLSLSLAARPPGGKIPAPFLSLPRPAGCRVLSHEKTAPLFF